MQRPIDCGLETMLFFLEERVVNVVVDHLAVVAAV